MLSGCDIPCKWSGDTLKSSVRPLCKHGNGVGPPTDQVRPLWLASLMANGLCMWCDVGSHVRVSNRIAQMVDQNVTGDIVFGLERFEYDSNENKLRHQKFARRFGCTFLACPDAPTCQRCCTLETLCGDDVECGFLTCASPLDSGNCRSIPEVTCESRIASSPGSPDMLVVASLSQIPRPEMGQE